MKIAFFSTNLTFCQPILDELNRNHTVKIWKKSVMGSDLITASQVMLSSILKLLDWCDVAYLEWTQAPNVEISQIQGNTKPLIAFCHGYDAMYHAAMDWNNIAALIIQDAHYPRLLRLRAEWAKSNPDLSLPKLPKKILIKSLGVDLQAFTPLQKPIPGYHIVVHASFIRPVKRIYAAIQQFYDLIQLDGDKAWNMTLIGRWNAHPTQKEANIEYLTACSELIEQLNFPPDRLRLKLGNFPPDIWAKFAQTADLYWCTSWRESFGVSMAEVCASGGYPLINNYLGADKVYPKKHLCKTPYEMIQKTIEWGNLSQKEKVNERHIIRKYIEQFDAKKSAKQIRLFIEEIVKN